MLLFNTQELRSKQPFLDLTFEDVYRANHSWDKKSPAQDIIFERFKVAQNYDLVAPIFPDGYSTLSFEFNECGHISPCYFGRMRQTKTVVYTKGMQYFVVKIPPHYIFDSATPIKELTNRVSRLEMFTTAFNKFPWETFSQLGFKEQVNLFQIFVATHLPYTQNRIINYVLTSSLSGENLPLIKDLADELGVSERYVRKIFTELLGTSPKQVIQAVRLQHAMSNILDYSKNVTDAYLDTDFYDQPHFNKFFKNQTTYSPTEFKNLIN